MDTHDNRYSFFRVPSDSVPSLGEDCYDRLDYSMLENAIQSNVHFFRDALKDVQDIRVGLFKNDSLLGNFMIPQPLSSIKVACHTVQMDSEDLNQNIPLMEEYGPVIWPILVVRSPNSLDFLDGVLSSEEAILEVIIIWLYPHKDIFVRHTTHTERGG